MNAHFSGTSTHGVSYADAGVNIDAGNTAVGLIAETCKKTHSSAVRHASGQFAALYSLQDVMQTCRNPLLVSGTDGVGTKLLIAKRHNSYEGIGHDCVAMCVNDIACHGAAPLFFLDYIACASLSPSVVQRIVSGIAEACTECGCSLVGGEMAEMPGMYAKGDYDVAGFAVGVVDECEVVDGMHTRDGDVLIGLASNGIHSNGFSLIRMLYPKTDVEFDGAPLHETLLKPTRLYVRAFQSLVKNLTTEQNHNNEKPLRALSHITGGGIFENIARVLPAGLCAHVSASAVPTQAIFSHIAAQHNVARDELWRTLNMGVGAVAVVAPNAVEDALSLLRTAGEQAFVMGEVRTGDNNAGQVLLHE